MSRELLEALFRDTIARLDPRQLTAGAVAQLDLSGPVIVIAAGKAAAAMAAGARDILGNKIAHSVVVTPSPSPGEAGGGVGGGGPEDSPAHQLIIADHPIPTQRSHAAGRALLQAVTIGPPVLALISGGASALACVPAPGITLAEKLAVTTAVMAAGAPIAELNCVRKHLSALKGGQLAVAAAGPVITLALSDVVGDNLSDIASGPTVPDPTSVADARRIIERYAPDHVDICARLVETPKQPRRGDRARVIAGTDTLIDRAVEAAAARGLQARVIGRGITGDVADVATDVAAALEPGCVIAGGEPTIALPPHPGHGGRAQHLALLLARHIHGRDIHILVAGSDGIDGNTTAAGAIVDGTTWDAVADPQAALARADAGTALEAVGAALVTGRTGVNHADVIIAVESTAPER